MNAFVRSPGNNLYKLYMYISDLASSNLWSASGESQWVRVPPGTVRLNEDTAQPGFEGGGGPRRCAEEGKETF